MATIKFGNDIELDPNTYELRLGGQAVRVERIPMQILLLLVERRPDLVTREQIADKVWGPGIFVDSDNSIRGAIRKLRLALKDDPENPRYIRTVTGMGYRFVAEVASDEPATTPTEDHHPPAAPDLEPHSSAMEKPAKALDTPIRWRRAAVLAPLVLVGSLILYLVGRSSSLPTPSGERLMLAVLPFENLTGDPAQEYFADGFTEEMIARLGRVDSQRLGVIARTSTMHYKQSRASLKTIGRELGVQYVLEGSVRRHAERVRITAQLILVKDQSHLWSRQYDRRQTEVLTVQAEVAHAIADRIQETLGYQRPPPAPEQPLSDRDYMAYDLYLKGRYFWNKRSEDGFERAIESFQQSIELNPHDARAHAGLADAHALMATFEVRPSDEAVPKALAAALAALEIDPELASAHTTLALINEFFDWDWPGAEERFRRAIELDGNYATAHQWYAEYLAHQGRFKEALHEIELARRLDPLSLIIASDHGAILYYARRYPEATDRFRAIMDVQALFARSILLIFLNIHAERFDEALALSQEYREMTEDPWSYAWAAYVYGKLGRAEEARKALEDMEESSRRLNRPTGGLLAMRATAYSGMGLREEVLASLQEACETRASFLVSLRVDPIFDFVRDDPRFQDLLRCVRLAS